MTPVMPRTPTGSPCTVMVDASKSGWRTLSGVVARSVHVTSAAAVSAASSVANEAAAPSTIPARTRIIPHLLGRLLLFAARGACHVLPDARQLLGVDQRIQTLHAVLQLLHLSPEL